VRRIESVHSSRRNARPVANYCCRDPALLASTIRQGLAVHQFHYSSQLSCARFRNEARTHMGCDIFLSYSRADQALAEQFIKIASEKGLAVWYDQMIEGGQDWRGRIVDALSTSKALVILFSEHCNDSHQIIKELAIADNLQKHVVPVLIAECEPRGAYLYELASRNWVNLYPSPETRLTALIDNLISALDLREVKPRLSLDGLGRELVSRPTPRVQNQAQAIPSGARETPATAAQARSERWFPLGRYDLYLVVPIVVVGFWLIVNNEARDKEDGFVTIAMAIFFYMFIVGVRNARLNRSIFSGKSLASFFVVAMIGISPAALLIVDKSSEIEGDAAIALGSTFMSFALANALQALLRTVFQLNIFRRNVD